MRKIALLLAFLFVIVCSFSACADESEDMKLAVCGSYAVPGMFCHDLKGGTYSCDVIERDSYGRILFLYETASVITEKNEKAYVVCQQIDSAYVYFYEDICYLTVADGKADIESLKSLNDWDMPLDDSCMSRRKHSISYDLYIMTDSKIDYNEAEEACCQALDLLPSKIYVFTTLDINQYGQELFFLSINNDGAKETYCVLINSDYEVFFANVENDFQMQIRQFKQENGWKKTE